MIRGELCPMSFANVCRSIPLSAHLVKRTTPTVERESVQASFKTRSCSLLHANLADSRKRVVNSLRIGASGAGSLPPDEQAEDQCVRDEERRHERSDNKEGGSEHSRHSSTSSMQMTSVSVARPRGTRMNRGCSEPQPCWVDPTFHPNRQSFRL